MAANRKSNRREFLSGQAALDAISQFPPDRPQSSGSQATKPLTDPASYLMQVGRHAMGCEFQVLFNAGQHAGATEAALEALDLVEALDQQLSWFREDSELTRINRIAAEHPIAVEERFFGLLEESVSLHEQTSGAFDITAGPLWQLWGFHRREGRLPTEEEVRSALERVGTQWISLDVGMRTVELLKSGVEINLGAIGKGYALDRCAESLTAQGIDDFVIHGGQSSIVAQGSRSAGQDEHGWKVALRHPLRHADPLGELQLHDRALGTSGSGNQFFHLSGKRYGHVLDPRRGLPAQGVLSATVLAPTAAQADALSTALFVMEPEEAAEFCRDRSELGALFVLPGRHAGSVEISTYGISDKQWRAA